MNNKEMIERIERVYNEDIRNFEYKDTSFKDSFSTALHGYYFVKPGKATKNYMTKLSYCIIDGIKEGNKIAEDDGFPVKPCSVLCIIPRITKLCQKSFDMRTFEQQINRINDDEFDDGLLKKYIEKLDEEQVSHLFQLIIHNGRKYHFFNNENECEALWQEINRECQNLDKSLPIINSNYEEFPMFIFDAIDKDVLANLLLKYVEKDKDLAGYIARVLYYVEPLDALEYFNVAMSFIDLFDFRAFD